MCTSFRLGSQRLFAALGVIALLFVAPSWGDTLSFSDAPVASQTLASSANPVSLRHELTGPGSCHEPGALCLTLTLPDDLQGRALALEVALHEQDVSLCVAPEPASFRLLTPLLRPGAALEVLLAVPSVGTYDVHATLFMPGGGDASGQPVSGIDYAVIAQGLVLTGAPLRLESPLALER